LIAINGAWWALMVSLPVESLLMASTKLVARLLGRVVITLMASAEVMGNRSLIGL